LRDELFDIQRQRVDRFRQSQIAGRGFVNFVLVVVLITVVLWKLGFFAE
jgi:hypothetical protein